MRSLFRFAIGAACAAPLLASATAYTWTGLGTTNNWQDTMNWSPSGFPGSADSALFLAGSQNFTPVVNASTTVDFVQFEGSGYVLSVPSILIVLNGIGGSQTGTVAMTGFGILTFANSAYAGPTSISIGSQARVNFQNASNAGTAAISVAGTLKFFDLSSGATAQVSLADGTLDVSNQTATLSIGSVSDSAAHPGSILLGSKALSLGHLNTNDTIYGTISGDGSLTKIGTGTLTLLANNTYAGTTTVQNGTLAIEGSQAGNVSVQSGAILSGGGEVGSVSNAGKLNPGGSGSDHLTLANLGCAAGSTVMFSLDTTAYLHFTDALQASACPLLDVSVQTSQNPIIGAQYMLASLDSGSDFTPANVNAHLAGAITRVYVENHAIVLQIYSADDYIFADGFGH